MFAAFESERGWRERFVRIEVVRDHVTVTPSQAQGFIDGCGQLPHGVFFEQSQNTDILPRTLSPRFILQPFAQVREALRQVPVVERLGVIECARLVFQQFQVMNRVKGNLLFFPDALVCVFR